MRLSMFEVSVTAMVAVAMASVVLVGGAALPLATEPGLLVTRQIEAPYGETGACIKAPASVRSSSVEVGVATLCVDGHDLRVVLQVTGLTPGAEYAAHCDTRSGRHSAVIHRRHPNYRVVL